MGIALRKFAPDVHFEIYEGASELLEVGAGITMQSHAWSVMEALDMQEALLRIAAGGQDKGMT